MKLTFTQKVQTQWTKKPIGIIIALISLSCLLLCLSCQEEIMVEDSSHTQCSYSMWLTGENENASELNIIKDTYAKYIESDFGNFIKNGDEVQCDKEVALACKDAEIELSGYSFIGEYSFQVVRNQNEGTRSIYSKTFVTSNNVDSFLRNLTWEQGRYTTTGIKVESGNVIRTQNAIIVNPGEKYSFTKEANTTTLGFYFDKMGVMVSPCVTIVDEITIPNGVSYMHISYRSKNTIDTSFSNTFKMYQIVENSTRNPNIGKMLTIIDDDSHIRYYTDIYPIALAKKASISSGVIAGQIDGRNTRMTWDNINEVYCNGMEILCHTYSHPLTTDAGWSSYDEMYFEEDFRKAKNILKTHGIDNNLLVFSGSSARYNMCQEACKRASFDGGFLAGDNKITYGDTDRYKIPRFRIGNDSDYHYDITILRGLVDKLSSSGGWMVWMVHTSSAKGWVSGTEEGSSAYMLGEIIDYARSNGISIVTAEYGFRKCYIENIP